MVEKFTYIKPVITKEKQDNYIDINVNKIAKSLAQFGCSCYDITGQLRSMQDIFNDLSQTFNNL